MIKYQNVSNELVFETKIIPQNCGEIVEQIDIDNYNSSCRYFLEIKCPKDNKYISEEILFKNNNGKIVLPYTITKEVGKVFIQLVVRDNVGDVINKSLVSKKPLFIVEHSINAVQKLDKERLNDCLDFFISTCTKLQGQLNSKPSIQGVNNLSMCPSGNIIQNVLPFPKKWNSIYYDYYAPNNGYVVITFKVEGNQQIQNTAFVFFDNENNPSAYEVNGTVCGFNNQYSITIPVSKGACMRFLVLQREKIIENSFVSNFVYSEVLK